jgi:alpha-tubulin suppressor-like RCC1 family protein/subtilisin family serine protease
MRPSSRVPRVVKWCLLVALLLGAGTALYWLTAPERRGDRDERVARREVSGAATEQAAQGGAIATAHSGLSKMSPVSAAAPGTTSATAVPSPNSPNPLPPVDKPYELEPELDLSTHYVIIKGHRAHPHKLLAKYKATASSDVRGKVLGDFDLRASSYYRLTPDVVVLKPAKLVESPVTSLAEAEARGAELMKRIQELNATGQFEYVEPDYIRTIDALPTDASFTDGSLWGLRNTGQSGGLAGADIDAVRAWDTTTGSTEVLVAVIDTGVRYTHQDLAAQMWRNPGEIAANGVDDDLDGYVDNVYGINGITNSGNPMDDNGHGTHCSGTIGAQANGGGPLVGVAWSVRIMACKFLSASGGGTTSDAIKCINFAVINGAHILSNSWGGGGFSQALADSITAANVSGVLFVAAAGNSSSNNDTFPSYPASYTQENIISVAALDRQDQLASFSNYGATTVDIGAPGVSIYSSVSYSDTSYASFSGTSMATPHVAGVAALVLANAPDISVSELRQRIFAGAVPISSLTGKCATGGRLNAHNSLTGEPDGELEVTVVPATGAELTGGATVPVFVYVRDFDAVTDATVTGTAGGSTSLTFVNDGTGADATANDNIYSSSITLPASGTSYSVQLQIAATGKTTATVDATYTVRQPPANDQFASRATISGSSTTVTGHNIGASRETGEPYHAGYSGGGKSVWWTWTAPANGTATFRTTGSTFDTIMGVYTGTAVNALTTRGGDDDSGGSLASLVTLTVTSGTIYQIAVDGFSASSTGNITLITSFVAAPVPPANDNFSAATTLSGTDATATGNNLIATKESGEPNHAGNAGGRSVWWQWTAPSTGVATVTTDGSLFDTTLGIYVGSSVTSLTAVASDNDSGEGTRSQASFAAVSGTTYRIAVDGFSGTSGNVSLGLSLVVSPAVPANDNFASATAVTLSGSSATVTGTNIGSSKETGEPEHVQNTGGRSVWWTWTAPSSGSLILNTTGSNFDTLLAVYTGTSVNALTEVATNDQDPTGGNTSRVMFNVTSGTTYRIAVDGVNNGINTALGSVTLNFTLSTVVLPPNDLFVLRTNVTSATATLTGSNAGATAETGEPYHYSTANKSVWWSWTAPASGPVLMSVTGTGFTPVLAVYTGTTFATMNYIRQAYGNGASYTSVVYFTATAGTTYQIAVDSYSSYSVGGNFTLSINPPIPQPVIQTQPVAQNRYIGDSVYLYVNVASSPVPVTYQWKRNGVNLTNGTRLYGATSSYLNIYTAEASDAGSYTVEVTNAGGTVTSSAAAVTVSIPPPPVISYHPVNQSVYIGEAISLFVSANQTGTTTYQWQKSTDGGATFTNVANAVYSYYSIYASQASDFTYYRVIVTNPGGSTTSNVALITPLTPLPPVISSHPTGASVQGGNSFYMYGYATGRGNITYRWQKDGVDVVNSDRIYGATSNSLSVYNARGVDAGQYRLVATNAGGSATSNAAAVTVSAPPAPTIVSQPYATNVVAGNYASFYVSVSGVGLSYQWQKDGVNLVNDTRITGATSYSLNIANTRATDAGQYRVVVSNDGGSVTSNAVALTVTLPAPPTFYSQPTDAIILQGSVLSLYGYASSSGSISYQWYKDDVVIAGATSANYYKPSAAVSDSGAYKLTATNAGGTTTSRIATVTVNPATAPAFTLQPSDLAAEAGDPVTLTAAATANPAATYQWYKNGALLTGATSTALSFTAQTADHNATFYARATNIAGTADSRTATLTVYAAGSGRVLGLYPATRAVGAGRVVYPLTLRIRGSWTATANVNWLALSSASGTGSRTLEITVAPNPLPSERTATVTVGTQVHTLTQRASGTAISELWAMGDNSLGQLGDASLPPGTRPEQAGTSVDAVAANRDQSFHLRTDGTLWATGINSFGQLGDGATSARRVPAQIATDVAAIAAGVYHTAILKTDGTLWMTGLNAYGQHGNGTTTTRTTPAQVATGVQAVAAGGYHTLILKTDGTLWTCGYNSYGQLGTGNFTNLSTPVQIATGVSAVAAGFYHTLFLKGDGTAWGSGYNGSGQLGYFGGSSVATPTQIATGIKSVASAGYSTFFIKQDDSLWACGDNSYGQLGDGGSFSRYTPVQIAASVRFVASGYEHTAFIKLDGTLWACGDNLYSELGDGSNLRRSLPVQIATGVATAAVGDDHTLFTKTDDTLWVMGSNFYGQLGNAGAAVEVRPTPISIASEVQSASAGENHTLFVKSDGSAWSVGGNTYGQLGDGSLLSRSQPVQVATGVDSASAGTKHSLLVKQDGKLLAAGGNDTAQVGDGTSVQRPGFIQTATAVTAVSAGGGHTLIRKTTNALVGIGSNYYGQLGNSSTGTWLSTTTLLQSGAASMAAGINHTLFIKSDGTLWAVGSNGSGQLGIGTTFSQYTPVAIAGSYLGASAGNAHSIVVKNDNTAWTMGSNTSGQLGDGSTSIRSAPLQIATDVRHAEAGYNHSMIVKRDGGLWAFGSNASGQLGNGFLGTFTSTPTRVAANVESVSAGTGHTVFIASGDVRVSAYTPPAVTSVSPTAPAAGATVTINGSGFTNALGVYFNNVAATSFTVVSATQITAVAPDTNLANLVVTVGTFEGVVAQNATTAVTPPATNPPASGGAAAGGGGGGGAPSLWFLIALATIWIARHFQNRRQ